MSHRQHRRSKKNSLLSELIQYTGTSNQVTTIELIQYNKTYFNTSDVTNQARLKSLLKPDCMNWYRVIGFSNIEKIKSIFEEFNIHLIDAKSTVEVNTSAHLNEYKTKLYLLVNSFYFDSENIQNREHISFVLGSNYLITFHETKAPLFDDVIDAIRTSKVQIREKNTDYLLILLLNNVLQYYIDSIQRIEEDLDSIVDNLINKDVNDDNILSLTQEKRKQYLNIKRVIYPFKDLIIRLTNASSGMISADNNFLLNALLNQIQYTIQKVDNCNESMNAILNLHFNNNNNKMNEIITRLTVISTIFIPLTFIVGVWGMNFEFMPEIKWEYGYLGSWIFMCAVALISWLYLKRKRWI